MSITVRIVIVALLLVLIATGIGAIVGGFGAGVYVAETTDDGPPPEPDPAAVTRALRWLWAQQQPDGLLAAPHYAVLRRGESVTAAALLATARCEPEERGPHSSAIESAFDALATSGRRANAREASTDYPCYTLACHLHALTILQPKDWQSTARRLLARLRLLQFNPQNGWSESEPAFGGFGLGDRPPTAKDAAELVTLSTTVAALAAARAAGVKVDDPLVVQARTYIERCQHFDPSNGDLDRHGGFFAAPTDEWRGGKGGSYDDGGKRAYGTATADGLRGLLLCGHATDTPRVAAAAAWLERNGDLPVPGLLAEFEPALRCYWAAARAEAAVARDREVPPAPGWLLERQRSDGALAGAFVGFDAAMKEDEPVVATILALRALRPGRP